MKLIVTNGEVKWTPENLAILKSHVGESIAESVRGVSMGVNDVIDLSYDLTIRRGEITSTLTEK